MTFPTKFIILSFNHFVGRSVTMSWRSTVSSPPHGLALAATTSLPLPRGHLLPNNLVTTFPVSLGMTPLLIMPMTSLIAAPGEDSFLRKSSIVRTLVLSLVTVLLLFPGGPASVTGAIDSLGLEPLWVLQKICLLL